MAELPAFLRGLFKNWQALLFGGIVAVGLTLWQWFGSTLNHFWYAVILLLTFLPAVYLTWRDEFRRANSIEAEVTELRKAAEVALEQKNAAAWKPFAELHSYDDGNELRNELILKDSRHFELLSVGLLSPEDAKLADIRIDPNLVSKGYSVHITQPDILKLWNRGARSGSVQYSVRLGHTTYTGSIPFVAETAVIRNKDWIRLIG